MAMMAVMLGVGTCEPAAAAEDAVRVPLADVLALAKGYPNLVQQVRLELVRAGVKREAVTCQARRLPSTFGKLGGTSVAPYRCGIGKRTLEITARQTFYDANGHKLADGAAIAARAVRVAQTNLAWGWR